jgi:hypothetical protein
MFRATLEQTDIEAIYRLTTQTASKNAYYLKQMTKLHNNGQLHSSLIIPALTQHPVMGCHTPTISKKQRRLLFQYLVGTWPVHPHKNCGWCGELSALSLTHLNACYELENKLPDPSGWYENSPAILRITAGNRLDKLISLLGPLTATTRDSEKEKWKLIVTFIEQMIYATNYIL